MQDVKSQENPLVSVIIPIYNVEKYLAECLDSVINQSLREIEIICINDGSTDKSGDIVKEYMKQDCRIISIDQKNQGNGAARNTGLDIAKGEWICFVDADDYIGGGGGILDMLNCAIQNQLDWVHNVNVIHFSNAEKISTLPRESQINIYSMNAENLLEVGVRMIGAVWNCLFNKQIIDMLHLRFIPRLRHEDEIFIVSYLPFCKNIALIKGDTYFYRQTAISLMGQLRIKQYHSLEYIQAFCEVIAYYEEKHLLESFHLPFYLIRGRGYYDRFCNPRFKNAATFFALAKSKLLSYPQHYFESDKLTLALYKSPHLIVYRAIEGYYRNGCKGIFKSLFRIKVSKDLKVIVLFGIRIYYKDMS